MEYYRIEPGASGFQVVGMFLSGHEGHAFCGFQTELIARMWAETYLGSDEISPGGGDSPVIALAVP